MTEGSANATEWRLLLAVGLCGGFTTFSAFGYETVKLLQDGSWGRAAAYVGVSVGLSVLGVAVGLRLAPNG